MRQGAFETPSSGSVTNALVRSTFPVFVTSNSKRILSPLDALPVSICFPLASVIEATDLLKLNAGLTVGVVVLSS